MVEFGILTVLLALALYVVGRRPPERVASRGTLIVLSLGGWIAGALAEALPFSAVARPFGWRTVLVGVLGVIVARLLFRVIQAWALSRRDWRDMGPEAPRITHPMILVGLFLTGVPTLFLVVVARHEALEVEMTPRDAETGIVEGAESIHLLPEGMTPPPPVAEAPDGAPDAPADDAEPTTDPALLDGPGGVLLLHGFMSSPTDFGELPERLRDDGYEVRVPRLPGHGTSPGDLAKITESDLREHAHAVCADLAARHRRVSVVGFSMGGALALDLADDFELHRLVLVNPYLGRLADRPWSPFSTDELVVFFAPALHAVIRPESMLDVARPEGRHGHLMYRTVPLAAVRQLQVLAENLDFDRPVPTAPVLLLRSEDDGVVQPGPMDDLVERLDAAGVRVEQQSYDHSRHLLLRDYDADDAVAAVRSFLASDTE